jgi:hypothetical protein
MIQTERACITANIKAIASRPVRTDAVGTKNGFDALLRMGQFAINPKSLDMSLPQTIQRTKYSFFLSFKLTAAARDVTHHLLRGGLA